MFQRMLCAAPASAEAGQMDACSSISGGDSTS